MEKSLKPHFYKNLKPGTYITIVINTSRYRGFTSSDRIWQVN